MVNFYTYLQFFDGETNKSRVASVSDPGRLKSPWIKLLAATTYLDTPVERNQRSYRTWKHGNMPYIWEWANRIHIYIYHYIYHFFLEAIIGINLI